jgi:hypothetical protein
MPGGLLGDLGWGLAFSEDELGDTLHKHAGYADGGETQDALVQRLLKLLKENPVLASRVKTTIEKHPDWFFGQKKEAWSIAMALLYPVAASGGGAAGAAGASSSAALMSTQKKVRKKSR